MCWHLAFLQGKSTMKKMIIPAALLINAMPATALDSSELKVFNVPAAGTLTTVSVGSQVHEYRNEVTDVRNVITIDTEMKGGQWLLPIVVPAGTEFYPNQATDSKVKFKACVDQGGMGYCGYDDDGDGDFDRMLGSGAFAMKLKKAVPYSTKVLTSVSEANSFKQVVLYQGATSDTLRLSYREFKNNMARDAFTQELTIPLSKTFPQDVAVKAVKLRVHKIDGLGMTYEVLP
jgi:hypothetical protein